MSRLDRFHKPGESTLVSRYLAPLARAVRRVDPTAAQAGLTNAKRRANVNGGDAWTFE